MRPSRRFPIIHCDDCESGGQAATATAKPQTPACTTTAFRTGRKSPGALLATTQPTCVRDIFPDATRCPSPGLRGARQRRPRSRRGRSARLGANNCVWRRRIAATTHQRDSGRQRDEELCERAGHVPVGAATPQPPTGAMDRPGRLQGSRLKSGRGVRRPRMRFQAAISAALPLSCDPKSLIRNP